MKKENEKEKRKMKEDLATSAMSNYAKGYSLQAETDSFIEVEVREQVPPRKKEKKKHFREKSARSFCSSRSPQRPTFSLQVEKEKK